MAGEYLSRFADNFLRARGAEEARSRAAGAEARDIFSTQQYLDELGRERGAESLYARLRGQTPSTPAAPAVAAPAEPSFAPPGAPTGALGVYPTATPAAAGPTPMATGGLAALQEPRAPRRPVAETVLAGLNPAEQARFLTTRTGRAAMPTLEQSERERRQEQDQQEVGGFFDQAKAAFRALDTVAGLEHLATGFRRLGPSGYGPMSEFMQLAAKTQAEKQEKAWAAEDAQAFFPALDAYKAEPTPLNLVALRAVEPKSLAWRKLKADIIAEELKKALSADRDEEDFLRAFMTADKSKSEEQAWADAAEKFPQGLFKFAMQELRSGKAILPDSVWDVMRLKRPLGLKDFSLRGVAHTKTLLEAAAAQQAGTPWDKQAFLKKFIENINEAQKAEQQAKETPEQQDRAAITKMRREQMEHPERLSMNEITLQIQRTNEDLRRGDMTPEEYQDAQRFLHFLRDLREKKRVEGGGAEKPAPATDKKGRALEVMGRLYPGRRWDQLTDKEKQRVAGQVK